MFTAILRLLFDHWKWSGFHKFVEREQLSEYDSLSWKHLNTTSNQKWYYVIYKTELAKQDNSDMDYSQ